MFVVLPRRLASNCAGMLTPSRGVVRWLPVLLYVLLLFRCCDYFYYTTMHDIIRTTKKMFYAIPAVSLLPALSLTLGG